MREYHWILPDLYPTARLSAKASMAVTIPAAGNLMQLSNSNKSKMRISFLLAIMICLLLNVKPNG